ncbi:MAG: tRNA 2-thiouridine(34) synthase MnmA [Bacteroidia bacterium]|nr:tRNA 2-thiouridine(34) synthase MnmA [Bacteroidia bacterium]
MARVVVGMSGGVDSSVAAHLLKEQGHEVIALFMRNWNEASVTLEDECPWIDDSRDAMMVAEQLGIPFQVLDLSAEYKTRIVDYMFLEYSKGKTPNPDVLCNREIKFDIFLKAALKLGADFVATGHYVQKAETVVDGKTTYRLLAGADPNKDQSYFLCQLNQEQLEKALFPIGALLKPEVRKIAEEAGLVTAAKKDSQGLCFIGKISLPEFLQQQLKSKKGDVIEILDNSPKVNEHSAKIVDKNILSEDRVIRPVFTPEDGNKIGEHGGAHYYTIGQRKGLQIGGKTEPLFVLQTDVVSNTVYVGQGVHHPALLGSGVEVDSLTFNWLRPDLALKEGSEMRFKIRIRYRQPLFEGVLQLKNGRYFALFDAPEKSITPGQFIAFYLDNELVASGEMI